MFTRYLKNDAARSLLSVRFWGCTLVYLTVSLLSLADEMAGFNMFSVVYLFELIRIHNFHPLYLILANLPAGLLLYEDSSSGFITMELTRGNSRKYACSKVLAVFFGALLWTLFSNLLLMGLLCLIFPVVTPDTANFLGIFTSAPMYLLFHFICESMTAGVLSLLTLLLTVYVPNIFVLIAAPIPVWYLLSQLLGWIPIANLNTLSAGYLIINESVGLSVVGTCAALLVYALLAAAAFLCLFRRRCEQ